MRVLLPPSETKRAGGSGAPLDLPALAFPELASQRAAVLDALIDLSGSEPDAVRVLKLGVRQRDQIAVNAQVRTAATMAALDRYSGVLYDAIDAPSLDPEARAWAADHVLIQSAMLGPIAAGDPIPAYRLSATTRLPGWGTLAAHWATATTRALESAGTGYVLDLRSESYAALGPIPKGVPSGYGRIVSAGADGTVRALNHFNKKTKGELVRALALSRPRIESLEDVLAWAERTGIRARPGSACEIEIFAG